MNRRRFLHLGLAAGLAGSAGRVHASVPGGRRFRTAAIGTGWWGGNLLAEAVASGACEIVGLCDVDQRALAAARARLGPLTADAPRAYRDYRELLERERPEIVIVATPDHWHALPTIAAVRAGAHVYVEKPTAHTIGESQAMLRAARRHGRVVQVGTHRRASPHLQKARELIRGGLLGTVGMVRCHLNLGGSGPEAPLPTVPVPPELDWNQWCGPAPLRPFNGGNPQRPDEGAGVRGIHPRGFRHYLDYANGFVGDIGVHWFDQVLWILEEKGPRRVHSTGGRPIRGAPVLTPAEQTSDAPDHQVVHYAFERFTMTWESRAFGGNGAEKGDPAAANLHGTKGTLHLGYRGGWTFYPADGGPIQQMPARLNEPDGQNIRELWADFLDAIRTGRRPLSDIEDGHRASVCSLLGMVSQRVGRSVAWDPDREVIAGDAEASRWLRREYRAGWTYPE